MDISDALVRFFYQAVIDELLKVFLSRTPTPVQVPFIIDADCDQGFAINDLNTLFLLFDEGFDAEVGLQKSDPETLLAYLLVNLFLIGRRVAVDDIPAKTFVDGAVAIIVIRFSHIFLVLWLLLGLFLSPCSSSSFQKKTIIFLLQS